MAGLRLKESSSRKTIQFSIPVKTFTTLLASTALCILTNPAGAVTADFTGSTATNLPEGSADTPANLNLGTADATWSGISTTAGSISVQDATRGWMTGNHLFIGRLGNESGTSHTTTATLDFDTAQTLDGTVFSLATEIDNSGGQPSKGLIVDIYDGTTLLASINFGTSTDPGYRRRIGELDASQNLVQDIFGTDVWNANDTGATITMNFGAATYTVSAVSEIDGPVGTSSALNYLNTPGTTFDKIVFTADGNKASWALDDIYVGPPLALPEFSADSPQTFTNDASPETFMVPFTNTGLDELSISSVTLSGPNAGSFTTPTVWTVPVAAGGGIGSISLPFTPLGPGAYAVDLLVVSDSPTSPDTISVDVEVRDPVAAVAPSVVDFGTDATSFTIDVVIENLGSFEDLTVNSVFVGDDPGGVFSVGPPPSAIAPGNSDTVTVTYTPSAATGFLTGTLEIDTDSYPGTQSFFTVPIQARETGTPVADFTADFEASSVDTNSTTIPFFNWLGTAANLSIGSAGGGWSGASTSVDPVSSQLTGLGVSDGTAGGMTGNWLLFGNDGNTDPTDSTDNANTFVSIELDSPRPLDGTLVKMDLNKLTSGLKFGEMRITGKDAAGSALFQVIAGSGGPNRNDLATASDAVGTVDQKLEDVWGSGASENNVAYTVQVALGSADYQVTADGGATTISGTYLASGSLASIEFHALDSKAQWGIDNISVTQGTLASPFDSWAGGFGLNPAWEAGDDPALDGRPEGDPDGDGRDNFFEFATDDDPTDPASSGKVVGKVQDVEGSSVLTLTLPVRGAPAFVPDGDQLVSESVDGFTYRIQGANDLDFSGINQSSVTEVTPSIEPMEPLNEGWTYRTFRTAGDIANGRDFMRAVFEPAP